MLHKRKSVGQKRPELQMRERKIAVEKKVDENPSEEKMFLNHWGLQMHTFLSVRILHFSWLQAATKTRPNRLQRSLHNLAEPFPGTEPGKARSSTEMSRD